jgi:hypothetical protein
MSSRLVDGSIRSWALAAAFALLAGCGGGGGGDDGPPPTGTLEATVVDEFGAPVDDAAVAVTVGGATQTDTTNSSGLARVTGLTPGAASVEISLDTFQTQTVNTTIVADDTVELAIELLRNTQAAGGVFTTNVIGTPSENGKVLTIELQVVVVDQQSRPIDTLTAGDFDLPVCTPTTPDEDPASSECVVFPEDAAVDRPYTVDSPSAENFALVPGLPEADYAATLMLDQSGSIRETDPTNARLFSAKAFLQSVDAASGDSVLLTAFASTEDARIATTPLWYGGTFTNDGESYFDELDELATQAAGDTPLYRSLFPEASDPLAEPGFTEGLIDYVDANAPGGLRKAIVIFTDGEDSECPNPDDCRAKRARVIAEANAADVSLFTIGLSNRVDFEALGELARGTDGIFLFASNAEQLIPLYGSLGDLLSRSLPTYTMRWTVRADTDGTFSSGHSVFGQLEIAGGGNPVTVPFIVGIP